MALSLAVAASTATALTLSEIVSAVSAMGVSTAFLRHLSRGSNPGTVPKEVSGEAHSLYERVFGAKAPNATEAAEQLAMAIAANQQVADAEERKTIERQLAGRDPPLLAPSHSNLSVYAFRSPFLLRLCS